MRLVIIFHVLLELDFQYSSNVISKSRKKGCHKKLMIVELNAN